MRNSRGASSVMKNHTPRPKFFGAFKKADSEKISEQLRRYVMSNLLSVLWTVILGVGGFFFLTYFWSIQYFPSDFDLNSMAALLAAIAVTGVGWVVLFAALIVFPALLYLVFHSNGGRSNKTNYWELALLLVLPIVITIQIIFFRFEGGLEWKVPFLISLIVTSIAWLIGIWNKGRIGAKDVLDNFIKCATDLGQSVLVGVVALMPLLVIFGLVSGFERNNPNQEGLKWAILCEVVILMIISNVLIAALHNRFRSMMFIAFGALFILVVVTQQWKIFSGMSVSFLKLGNIRNVNLILDKQGCQIAQQIEVIPESSVAGISALTSGRAKLSPDKPDKDSSSDTCVFECVDIKSRIGQEYYLEVNPDDRNCAKRQLSQRNVDRAIQFVIPSSHVLSWSIPLPVPKGR